MPGMEAIGGTNKYFTHGGRLLDELATPPNATIMFEVGHTDSVTSVAFSPTDPNLLASGSLDNTVRLWDVGAMRQMQVLLGHASSVSSVAFSRCVP